jgi:hypothetical protein
MDNGTLELGCRKIHQKRVAFSYPLDLTAKSLVVSKPGKEAKIGSRRV